MEELQSCEVLLTEEGSLAMQLDYEIKSDAKHVLSCLPYLMRGVARGELRPRTLLSLARAGVTDAALKQLYRRFPAHFGQWSRAVEWIWWRVEQERYRYFDAAGEEL